MSEREDLARYWGEAGGDRAVLDDPASAHLAASGSSIVSSRSVAGLIVDARETDRGIAAQINVQDGVRIAKPVHLCFGVLHREGDQEVLMDVRVGKGAVVSFVAHCLFPNALKVRHVMDASVDVAEGGEMRYTETHYHGPYGGVEVVPKLQVRIGKNGRYATEFTLTTGRVGTLSVDYTVHAAENAVAELTTRVFGHKTDEILIVERVVLAGENARGMIKARVAIEDDARAEIRGSTEGNAAGARGHVDCLEIVKDRAVARAVPIVEVNHPLAKVTHEAAIGSVDKRQLETLMAHGLLPEEAVDLIVKGALR